MFFTNRFNVPTEYGVDQFNRTIIEMIAEDMQPFSIVENRGFQKLVKFLDSRYTLPSRRTIERTLIPNIYNDTKLKVFESVSKAKHVAITSDVWTSMNAESYLTATVNFFDADLQLKTFVLSTEKLTFNHTAQHLSEVLRGIFHDWNIQTKVCAIVTDSGANIKAAVRLLGISHIPCTAHKLNNIVTNSLKLDFDGPSKPDDQVQIITSVKLCRSIVSHFKHSEVHTRLLVEKQQQMCLNVLKLKQDVPTRWNSTLIMLERLLQIKEPLTVVSLSIKRCPTMPTNLQWTIVEDLVMLLKPFETLTVQLSYEKKPTLGKVIPLIRGNY